MSENKILASVSSSLKTVSAGINTLNENIGSWAEEYAFRAHQESLLELEVMVMEMALKTVQEKAKREKEYQELLNGMDPQTRKIFDKL
ncbi:MULTISPECIES: hypothetical protein [unclassified Leclercia]|uniref:Uncharacterized protein n=1 Tax=Leclercia barmai TaxID=2785629 RepID=A0ABS7RZN0_9ENTR|nr:MULTISPECIES: hypothetical protein [unclassified Leclercia]MBZ0059771.1 hypothetical protein [Leclercia sp. EMC7]MCM5695079.1 hypothetical protein [Leclercia sp. LTM01]MCM5699489.1 hypothetical protein [Leclercia sp. LTM14]